MSKINFHLKKIKKGLVIASITFFMFFLFVSSYAYANRLQGIRYLGNYPSDKWGNWTERLQGVGHDRNNWLFTQKTMLWKIPLRQNLRHTRDLDTSGSFPGVAKVEMPRRLSNLGYDHFGDLDVENGYAFIPVEDVASRLTPVIAVFDASNLRFIDYAYLNGRTRSGWCAISPNGELFTSHNQINSNRPIDVYSIDWNKLKREGELDLQWARNFQLTNIPQEYGDGLPTYMQGGDFSTDGRYLFLLNGRVRAKYKTRRRGIWIFQTNDNYSQGSFVRKSTQNGESLRYEYKPALFQEPQGITYWNIDSRDPHGPGGQLHAILLRLRAGKDAVWFKHYRLNYLD